MIYHHGASLSEQHAQVDMLIGLHRR